MPRLAFVLMLLLLLAIFLLYFSPQQGRQDSKVKQPEDSPGFEDDSPHLDAQDFLIGKDLFDAPQKGKEILLLNTDPLESENSKLSDSIVDVAPPVDKVESPLIPGAESIEEVLSTEGKEIREFWLSVYLNGQNLNQVVLIQQKTDDSLWLPVSKLKAWRFNLPEDILKNVTEEGMICLDELEPVTYRIEMPTQSLWLEFPANQLLPSSLRVKSHTLVEPDLPSWGGFFNYDLATIQYSEKNAFYGQYELGFFGQGWFGSSGFLQRYEREQHRMTRLDTSLTRDFPLHLSRLKLGDTISHPGSWGVPLRFGGVQWGTEFSTQPNFVSFPLPSLSGDAALPSNMEVFVNNASIYRTDIEPGPFSVHHLPVVTGEGELRMVVRDMAGREQVIVQPFYASSSLLKTGLHSYSYEMGKLRNNYGYDGNDYDEWMLAATHRYGVNPELTAEAHAVATESRQTFGASVTALLLKKGILDLSWAESLSEEGSGHLFSFAFKHRSSRWSAGFSTTMTSRQFTHPGAHISQVKPRMQSSVHLTRGELSGGSLGLGYIRQDNWDTTGLQIVSGTYSLKIGREWSLGVSAFKELNEEENQSVGIYLTRSLGKGRTTGILADWRDDGEASLSARVQKNLPVGTGVGYRLEAALDGNQDFSGELSLQNDVGTYSMEASRLYGNNIFRASARGSVASLGKELVFSRWLDNSFAVVRVPGYENVGIFYDNQAVAYTDNSGRAIVPNLRAYEENRLSIEPSAFSLDVKLVNSNVSIVPYARSGYAVEFKAVSEKSATLRILVEDSSPVPAGSILRLNSSDTGFPIGVGGLAYATGWQLHNQVIVELPNGAECNFNVDFAMTHDVLPDLGEFMCVDVRQ